MNREIKFRAWSEDENRMIFDFSNGNAAIYQDDSDGTPQGIFCGGYMRNGDWHQPILMQYTGLNDKNGQEIYECDIVRKDAVDYLFKVGWNQNTCGFWLMTEWNSILDFPERLTITFDKLGTVRPEECGNGYLSRNDLEVIGNIWEHPHLLKNEG